MKNSAINANIQEWRDRVNVSVWGPKQCKSYYQQGSPDNRPWGIWPGTTTEYFLRTRNLFKDNFYLNKLYTLQICFHYAFLCHLF